MCDIYSYFFGILVILAWILTLTYSHGYIKLAFNRNQERNFFKYLALSIFAVLGNGYAGNLPTLFLFYFLMIFFTAPLILERQNATTEKAHQIYLGTHLGTSLLLFLPAILLLKFGNFNLDFIQNLAANSHLQSLANHSSKGFSALILLLFVFGIAKNAIIPFHQWITRTTIAPTPVSALLHSVAAVKSGSIAIIKIAVYIFGLDYMKTLTNQFWTGGWIFYLCGLTAIYAAIRAYKTTKIKSRFAYSTISQLSYILSSVLIANKLAVMGAVLHIISHSLCKIVLFYIAGIFSSVYGTNSTKDAARIAPHLKFWIACLTFCGASIIGIPFLPGSYGKDFMLISELETHHYSAILFLLTGSLINILYIYPIVKAGFFSKKTAAIKKIEVPWSMRIAILLGIFLALSMNFFITDLVEFFKSYDV